MDDSNHVTESHPDMELFREPEAPTDEEGLEASGREAPRPPRMHRVIAVSGAKGGAGKSLVATNLALYLASIGRRVVVVDADAGGSNVHTMLGMDPPPAAVPDVSDGGAPADLEEHMVDTPIPGLRLLRAGLCEPGARPRRPTRVALLRQVRDLEAEYIVVDLGSGVSRSLVEAWLSADLAVFVTLPEPTAIENTYRFIRCAFVRRVLGAIDDPDQRRRLLRVVRDLGGAPAALDLAHRLEADGDSLAFQVRGAMRDFVFRVVLNQTRLRADLELGDRMRSAVRRRLGVQIDYLGYIDYDDTAWNCVRLRRPLLVESPGTKASRSIEKISRRIWAIDTGKAPAPPVRSVPPETHHDLLEVDRGATDEEVRRAYKRAKEVYADDALCCYGLFDLAALRALRGRLEEAYDVLLDPARRRPYELSVFPPEPGRAPKPPEAESKHRQRPPAPVITPDTEFGGGLLRAVRESQGIELADISQRTKIGDTYLRALEDEEYGSLPAPVYVRGFVTEVAKCLKLDPEQVARTYVRRYRRFLEEQDRP